MKKRVLIVEDEVAIVNFLGRFLKRLKIEGIKATSGKEALESYDKHKDTIELVFLDIQLKDMSGFEVLQDLKKIDPSVRVIMVTGRREKYIEDRARELGVIDYLIKPLDLAEFKEKVDKYLSK